MIFSHSSKFLNESQLKFLKLQAIAIAIAINC